MNNSHFFFNDSTLKKLKVESLRSYPINSEKNAVFYYLHDNEQALNTLFKRIENHKDVFIVRSVEKIKFFHEDLGKRIFFIEQSVWEKTIESILDLFYPKRNHLILVPVTGTNGKTTTVQMCEQMSNMLGVNAVSMGTLGILQKGKKIADFEVTNTPHEIDFRRLLFLLPKEIECVFFEWSSHALHQKRLGDLRVDFGMWTNLTPDHLDYHKNMDDYFKAKFVIFSHLKKDGCVFVPEKNKELIEKIESISENGRELVKVSLLEKNNQFPTWLQVGFNLENLSLARKAIEKIAELKNITNWENKIQYKLLIPPKGRIEFYEKNGKKAVVDYAHTPDALEKILKELKKVLHVGGKLICLFGCGGDRDSTKRPIMGKIAERNADIIILTSDNPRTENPQNILADIMSGVENQSRILLEEDRLAAIKLAISLAKINDIILIAGKGHENYQEIMGVKHHFDDGEIVLQYL
jgi:UDP-N-acetylmuramoyl-L-alanyl-D-glutamate--2,6-diaminopimelate ligase